MSKVFYLTERCIGGNLSLNLEPYSLELLGDFHSFEPVFFY